MIEKAETFKVHIKQSGQVVSTFILQIKTPTSVYRVVH